MGMSSTSQHLAISSLVNSVFLDSLRIKEQYFMSTAFAKFCNVPNFRWISSRSLPNLKLFTPFRWLAVGCWDCDHLPVRITIPQVGDVTLRLLFFACFHFFLQPFQPQGIYEFFRYAITKKFKNALANSICFVCQQPSQFLITHGTDYICVCHYSFLLFHALKHPLFVA